MAKNNPNGANQYQLDPRQEQTLAYYTDPKSDTFGNLLKSALKAGYTESYSRSIYSKAEWLDEKGRDLLLIEKAEKNLLYFLTDTKDERIKADITKFISERLNKKKYSTRNELTGADGKDLRGLVDVE